MGPGCMWPTALPFVCALTLSGQTEGYVPSDPAFSENQGLPCTASPLHRSSASSCCVSVTGRRMSSEKNLAACALGSLGPTGSRKHSLQTTSALLVSND